MLATYNNGRKEAHHVQKSTQAGLLILTALTASGCTSFKAGVESIDRLPHQPPATALGSSETLDDLFFKVAQRVPAFGGMFFEFLEPRRQNRETAILYIHLLDHAQQEAALQAVVTILGPFYPDLLPPSKVQVLPARYSFLQLKEWFDLAGVLHNLDEVTMTDIDEVKNRLTIGLKEMNAETVTLIEQELARLGIPREAVVLEETGPFIEDKGSLTIEQALDKNRNGFLDDPEIMKALDLWVRQAPVPGTAGLMISDTKLLELLKIWQARQPLPPVGTSEEG